MSATNSQGQTTKCEPRECGWLDNVFGRFSGYNVTLSDGNIKSVDTPEEAAALVAAEMKK